MKIFLIGSILILCLSNVSNAVGWQNEEILVHSGIGSDCDLVIDEAGGLHVCFHYRTNSLPGADLYYAFKPGAASDWEITPVDEDYSNVVGANCEIDLDSNDQPHISYIFDWEVEGLPYIRYAAFDGSEWLIEQLTFSPEYASSGTSIVMEDDIPHLFYFTYSSGLIHRWKNEQGTWLTETLDSAYSILYPHAAIDPSGQIGLAYFRLAHGGADWELHYAHHDGISWQVETAFSDNPCYTYWQLDMVYDQDGYPHITNIASQTADNLSLLSHTWFDGSSWNTENLRAISTGTFSSPAIAVDNNNHIHVVYGERPYTRYDGTFHHISNEGGTWADVIVVDTINPWNSAIVIDHYNQPQIVRYADGITSHTWRSAVTGVSALLPTAFSVSQNVPNPFNPSTSIRFSLPVASMVNLRIYDISGCLVDVLLDAEMMSGGRKEAVWNGRDVRGRQVSAGVYFYLLDAGKFSETKRMLLVK